MKNLFLVFCLVFSIGAFAQSTLPQVDSVIVSESTGHVSIEEKNGDLYWHFYCLASGMLEIYFNGNEEYKIKSVIENSQSYFYNGLGKIVLDVYNHVQISNPTNLHFIVSDSTDTDLFDIYVDFDVAYEISSIVKQDQKQYINKCNLFGSTEFDFYLTENAQNSRAYINYKDPSFIYGHYENDKIIHYDEFDDVPFENEDSVIIKRLNEPLVYNRCRYIQSEDTLTYENFLKVYKGTNEVQNLIEKSPNYPSEICPGQKSVVRVKDGETLGNLGWHEKTRNEFYKDWSSSDSMIATKPGSYVLSEIYFNGAAGECPVVSNAVEIVGKDNCKGYLPYYVKSGSSTPLSGVKVKADNGQVEISDENGKVEFQFPYDNLISKIEIADTNYYYSYQAFGLDSEFPYYETERSYLTPILSYKTTLAQLSTAVETVRVLPFLITLR